MNFFFQKKTHVYIDGSDTKVQYIKFVFSVRNCLNCLEEENKLVSTHKSTHRCQWLLKITFFRACRFRYIFMCPLLSILKN